MTTTITATPRPGAAAVDLRIVRDDTTLVDTVAEWTFSDAAAATAELANWSNASTFMEELEVTNASVRALTGITAGQRYFVESYSGFADAIKAGSTSLVSTREVPFVGRGARRNVAEIIAPSGGFNLVGGTLGGAPLLGYKVTRLDDQRLMFGPVIPAGNESTWTAQAAAPYASTSKDRFGNDLRFNWAGASGVQAVAANALKGYRSFTTTTGRNYTLTVAGQSDNTGTSVGLTFEVLNGSTVLASGTTTQTGSRTVRLAFTAPSSSITFQVSNRQPFNSSGVGGSASFSLQALTLERLPSDDLSTAPYTITSLSRSDGNGVRQVRLLRGADLVDGTLSATDYEPALDGLLAYTVMTERVGVPGSREIATTSTRLDAGGNVFIDAATPRLRFTAELVETYTATNATSAVFHDVIGRGDPVVSEGVQRLRDGSMRVWFPTYEAAKDAIAAFGRGKTMLWRSTDNAGLDMYFRSVNVSSAPYDAQTRPRRWYLDAAFREVATPTVPLEGAAAWNFGASAERNATFFDSFNEFSTFADLLNGPEEV